MALRYFGLEDELFYYAYDAAGNLNRRTNNALVQTFTVDILNQLTSATRSGTFTVAGTTTSPATNVTVNTLAATRYADRNFAKDGFTLADGTNTFTAIGKDSLGRVDTNVIAAYLPATPNCQHDGNGNLLFDGLRGFVWDDENQLTRITVTNGWKSVFTYDGKMRRRIRKEYSWNTALSTWVLTNEVRYVYDGNLVLQERDQFNLPKLTYTRGNDLSGSLEGAGGIGGLLALTQNSTTPMTHAYYHADGNGNVTCLVDTNQNVVARYLYDPFGNTLSKSGPLADVNRYRFSSMEHHEPSGIVLYKYRAYIPELQRWGNRDPIEERGGINLYEFVRNEPISLYDPDGRSALVGGIIIITVGDLAIVISITCLASPPCAKAVIDAAIQAAKNLRDICRTRPKPRTQKECDDLWDKARKDCADAWSKPWAPPGSNWGKSLADCAKGLVPEECGGNPTSPPSGPRGPGPK